MPGQAEICGVVAAMVEAVNRGDFGAAASAFGDDPVIVEDIAPFRWRGASAVADWLSAMGANAAMLNASAIEMSLGEATRVEIEADRAYAIFPGNLRLVVGDGELGADGLLTFVLARQSNRWLIDALVWSGGRPA